MRAPNASKPLMWLERRAAPDGRSYVLSIADIGPNKTRVVGFEYMHLDVTGDDRAERLAACVKFLTDQGIRDIF